MTVRVGPICQYCVHYEGIPDPPVGDFKAARQPRVGRCTAFGATPIPEAIWRNRADHRQPFEGDGGVQFQPYDEDGVDYAAALFDPDFDLEAASARFDRRHQGEHA